MAQLANDNFARADGSLGANWTVDNSSPAIHGNQFTSTINGVRNLAHYSAITWPNDHYSEAAWQTVNSSNSGVYTRIQSGAVSAYLSLTDGTNLTLYKVQAGTFTQLAQVAYTPVVNDVVRTESQGTTQRSKVNGVLKLTATDALWSSGSPGLDAAGNQPASGGYWGNWAAGNFLSAVTSVDLSLTYTNTDS